MLRSVVNGRIRWLFSTKNKTYLNFLSKPVLLENSVVQSQSLRKFTQNANKKTKGSNQRRENSSQDLRGPVTFASLGLMAVGGLSVMYYYTSEKQRKQEQVISQVKSVGKPALGGSWTLVDQDGIPRTDLDFRGQWVLLYFGFTRCPDICPSELVKIGKIIEELDKVLDVEVKPVFISVDPDRDSVGQLKSYAQDFHPRISYLTGTKDQVFKAAKAYRVYFSKAEEHDLNDDEYLVDHSIVIYLNGPDGKFLDFFTQSTKVTDCIQKTVKQVKQFEGPTS